jgi:glutathione S-transferase
MAEITLYSFGPSHNAARGEIVLLEKGVAFEKVEVDLFSGANRRPPLVEVNPRGQVPTLVYEEDGESVVVYESVAIIRFLDDVLPSPPLMPPATDLAARALAEMRIAEFQNKLDAKNVFGSVAFGGQSREQLGVRADALLEELARWDGYLEGRSFLAGEAFSLADVAVFPLMMHIEALGYDFAGRAPRLAAWVSRCKQRPSVVASGWLERFDAFVMARAVQPVLAD